jgi:starch phosphorylase
VVLERFPSYKGNPYTWLASLTDAEIDVADANALIDTALGSQQTYLKAAPSARSLAYFSAEFGIDASLPIYSGGLGVLAGDHLRAASDAKLPIVAVGLMYHSGYFQQTIGADGRQHESYPRLDLSLTPLQLQTDAAGDALLITIPFGERAVQAHVWRADVGRVPLYLLDTDIDANPVASDREICWRLYGGGPDMRIRQEIVLGIGGVRALRALGYDAIDTFHMNEGHAAFLLLDLIREGKEAGLDFACASNAARRHAVFTTHTPVAAGHDSFEHSLLLYYLGPWWRGTLDLTDDELVGLGGHDRFSMTELALNLSRSANGVAVKHGEVSRAMFPGRKIGAVTNGVHHPRWTGPHAAAVFDARLPGWREDANVLSAANSLPVEDVRAMHQAAKRDLLNVVAKAQQSRAQAARERAGGQNRNISPTIAEMSSFTDDVLTIGIARRMTGYKRATLLFHDTARLARIAQHGLQVVVAGKAHEDDWGGKEIIAQIVHETMASTGPVRVVFLEGYDMNLATTIVAGVDVWLNTPARPLEASGTSGMKALLNGVPSLSVLDGWWIEGFRRANGWAIGEGLSGADDACDADSLYTLLEYAVLSEYYERQDAWVRRMCQAIATAHFFTAQRMVAQYATEVYGST